MLVRLYIEEILPSRKNFFCYFYWQLLQHLPKIDPLTCFLLGSVSICWVCSLSDYSLFSFGLFFTPLGLPRLRFIIYSPYNSYFFTINILSSLSFSLLILVLTYSIDFVSKRWTKSWNTFNSFRLLSDDELICFFIFLAPFGLPLPLFSWNFLLDSSKNYYSEDFSILSFRLFLLPLGLPRHLWSMLLLNENMDTFVVVIRSIVNRKNHQISHD